MTPIHVDVRASREELLELVAALPRAARFAGPLDWLWRTLVAFAPGPILLGLFGFGSPALWWSEFGALVILILLASEIDRPRAKLGPGEVAVDDEGLHVQRGGTRTSWPWYAVRELSELDAGLVFWVANDEWLAIPHASFTSAEHQREFVEAARAQLNDGAREAPALGLGVEPSWPHPGLITFALILSAGLGWLAWDDTFWRRVIFAPLAASCLGLALPELKLETPAREVGAPGERPPRPQPGSESKTPPEPARARHSQAVSVDIRRPSSTAVLVVLAVVAALIYAAQVAGTIATIVCAVVALAATTLGSIELFELLDWWWPRQLRRAWREVEVGPLGVCERDVRVRVSYAWSEVGELRVGASTIELRAKDETTLIAVPHAAFADDEARDEFIALARSRATTKT